MSNIALLDLEVSRAVEHAQSGRWADAEMCWMRVLTMDASHQQALMSLGLHALHRRDHINAVAFLERCEFTEPYAQMILHALISAYELAGDSPSELRVINAALVRDAYDYIALTAKGWWLERFGDKELAISTYRNSIRIAPPIGQRPAALEDKLRHAEEVVRDHALALHAALRSELAKEMSGADPVMLARWQEAISICAGLARPKVSEANQLLVPRLPAIPFYDRSHFAWINTIEAATDEIEHELRRALGSAPDAFSPYIQYQPGDPVNQWLELNHSPNWSALHLWRGGHRDEKSIRHFPFTVSMLNNIGMASIGSLCPNAMFSVLAPGTHIPPHHGETNARLVAHLPLIVPEGCWLRVGNEIHRWQRGKVVVFDDTLEHEAMNPSNQPRVVLIFDVWNPLLENVERDWVNRVTHTVRSFRR